MLRTRKGIASISLSVVFLFCAVFLISNYDVPARHLLSRGLEKLGLANGVFAQLLAPPSKYVTRPLDGQIRLSHPRILLPQLRLWNGQGVPKVIQARIKTLEIRSVAMKDYEPCGLSLFVTKVACWLKTGDSLQARHAVAQMLALEPDLPSVRGQVGDSWEWALAFDMLSSGSQMSDSEREIILTKLRVNLRAHLRRLDGAAVALWHNRTSLASQAWLLAVVLDRNIESDRTLQRRAQGHFYQSVRAVQLTEAWPEGYNYWINNRGFLYALASSAYVNGLQGSLLSPEVLASLTRVGLWTLYATRPDLIIEGSGDEGPRVDLKDETRRVIDLVTQLTGNRVFATYSGFLAKVHGAAAYNHAYRWSHLLLFDPMISGVEGLAPGDLKGLARHLPNSEVFGDGAMNLVITRSGWSKQDTFVSFRAGHSFTHHGHYDAGHFTLFKGAPLIVNSSSYNGYVDTPHRLNYSQRTVAKNSLLVMRPGDRSFLSRLFTGILFKESVDDGGQRVVFPTGNNIQNVDQWRNNIGALGHFEGGRLDAVHFENGTYAYTRADLSGAYDSTAYDSEKRGGKISSAVREFFYLIDEDRLLIYDKVVSTDPGYTKKWILHTSNQPLLPSATRLQGQADAGIFESNSDALRIENNPGSVDVKRILPKQSIIRMVGGEGYRYYVEHDGIDGAVDGEFNGTNFVEGSSDSAWFDSANWRIEIQPRSPQLVDRFLVSMSPALGEDRSAEVEALEFVAGELPGLVTPNSVVLYTPAAKTGMKTVFLMPGNQQRIFLLGVEKGEYYRLTIGNRIRTVPANSDGVLAITLPTEIDSKIKISISRS